MFISFLLSVLQASAAVPTMSPMELLSLPESNRIEVAKKNSKDLYPKLVELAFSEDRSIPTRWKALILASSINRDGSAVDIDRALNHSQWFMRNAALVALKTTHPEKAQRAALQLLSDKALVVRSAAVSVIDEKSDPRIRFVLWQELQAKYNFRDGDGLWVRKEILEKLSQYPLKQEYSSFGKLLQENDKDLHLPAIVGLEKITNKHLGTSKSTLTERENLWKDYLNKHPSVL